MILGSKQRYIRIKPLITFIREELRKRRKGTSVTEVVILPFSPVEYPRLITHKRKTNE